MKARSIEDRLAVIATLIVLAGMTFAAEDVLADNVEDPIVPALTSN